MSYLPIRGKGPAEWEDPEPHVLVVTAVEPPQGKFDDGSLEYEVEHLPGCKPIDDPEHMMNGCYDCAVAWELAEGDPASSFRYSGTPITEPGRYLIKAWGRRDDHWELGSEWDGGLAVFGKADQ